jgi:hypothetical protein
LKTLGQPIALQLGNSQVTDAGLASLQGLKDVRVLRLEHDKITDVGLESVSTMTGIGEVVLTGTQVTDAGIKKLKRAIPSLDIEKLTTAEDRALEIIQNPRSIEPTSNVVVGTWSDGGKLIGAGLNNATDTDLRRLREHLEVFKGSLQELRLSGEGVTDAGLSSLKGLSQLRRLTLTGTRVTDQGVQELGQTLPQLKVSR